MPHRRERFERSDVPRPSHIRNIVSAVVLVAIGVGLYLLVTNLWTRANLDSHLGDNDLSSAVEGQADLADLSGEYALSQDSFRNYLTLTVSSLDDGATLTSASLLVIDVSANTAVLANVPATVSVSYGGSAVTLADLYQAQGAAACVTALGTATNVRISHVIVTTSDVLERIAELSGVGVNGLISNGSDLLMAINTDMSSQELLDLAQLVQSVGTANITRIDAPTYADGYTAEDGSWVETGITYLDAQALNVAVGILVPASADASEAVEGEAAEGSDVAQDVAAQGA